MERTISIPESEIPDDSWRLVTVEKALSVEPLLTKPEWFADEENPTEITPDMLESLPGSTPALLSKLKELEEYYKKYTGKDKITVINKALNPLTVNRMSAILAPAKDLFTGMPESRLYAHTVELLGDQVTVSVRKSFNQIMSRLGYKRLLGKDARDIGDLIKSAQEHQLPEPDIDEMISTQETIRTESLLTPEEIDIVYAIGKLASFILRDTEGISERPYAEKDKYLGIIAKSLPEAQEKNYSSTIDGWKKRFLEL